MAFGLYIHIPFCLKKCNYCDFVSAQCDNETINAYFGALKHEIAAYKGICIDTVFFGGGTPSCVAAHHIADILEAVHTHMSIKNGSEITIEANPCTITPDKLNIYRQIGINRISLGVQSLQDNELAALGRIHTADEAVKAVDMLQKSGFTNYNLDLMLAIPHQTPDTLRDTLSKAVALAPAHISAYSLIIEEGTPFYRLAQNGSLPLPDEDTERTLCDFAYDFLQSCGYNRYEISNFAKNGHESRHNLKYWQCLPYIGLGTSAHSFDGTKRYFNTSDTDEYIRMLNSSGCAKCGEEILSEDDKISEYIIMSLRLSRGIIFDEFFERFGFRFEDRYQNTIQKHLRNGFFDINSTGIHFTNDGFALSNPILADFV